MGSHEGGCHRGCNVQRCSCELRRTHTARHGVQVTYGHENSRVVSLFGKESLKVHYPRNSIAPSNAKKGYPLGGLGFYAAPSAVFPGTDVQLTYKMWFGDNFQPARGGKLPGLFLSRAGAGDTSAGSGGKCARLRSHMTL